MGEEKRDKGRDLTGEDWYGSASELKFTGEKSCTCVDDSTSQMDRLELVVVESCNVAEPEKITLGYFSAPLVAIPSPLLCLF